MAHLTPPTGGDRDRGQLFVIGGLALATVFVVLAVLLNSAIYAGSVATRDDGTHAEPAIEYERAATAAAADAMREVTRGPTPDATPAAAFEARLERWRALADRHVASRGAVGTAAVGNTTPGTYGAQTNASRRFVNASGVAANWTLVRDAPVRAFEAAVDPSAAADPDGGESAVLADAFHVRFVADAGTWSVAVFGSAADAGEVCVRTFRPDGTADSSCHAGPTAAVSFTGGTVDGEPSPALGFLSAGESYTVTYRNGDAARGTYGFVARGGESSIETANFAGRDAAGSPSYSAGVYDATIGVNYLRENVRYGTTVRVAPGEPDA